jgi:hypothetical protein
VWQAALGARNKGKCERQNDGIHDEDHMQVDHTKIEKLSDKEREQLCKRGACFFCHKDGHMAQECPDKPKKGQNNQVNNTCTKKPKACVVEVDSDTEEKPPAYKATPLDVYASIRSMSKAKRDKLLEKLIDKGSGNKGKSPKEGKDF